jgi:hypothetical protein
MDHDLWLQSALAIEGIVAANLDVDFDEIDMKPAHSVRRNLNTYYEVPYRRHTIYQSNSFITP